MIGECGTSTFSPRNMLVPPKEGPLDVLTVVLDLDETLIYGRDTKKGAPVETRPFLSKFLEFLDENNCEVIVWTAGVKKYAQRVCKQIDPNGVIKHCVYRHEKWYAKDAREYGYEKNLALTGRDPDTTILVDNTPDMMRGNEINGIVCSDFEGCGLHRRDVTLIGLRDIIKGIIDSKCTVPTYLASCKHLMKMTVSYTKDKKKSVPGKKYSVNPLEGMSTPREAEEAEEDAPETYDAYFLDLKAWGGVTMTREMVMEKMQKKNPDLEVCD